MGRFIEPWGVAFCSLPGRPGRLGAQATPAPARGSWEKPRSLAHSRVPLPLLLAGRSTRPPSHVGCQEGEVLRICALPLATPTGFGPNRFSIAKIEVSMQLGLVLPPPPWACPAGCPASSLCPTGKIQVAAVSWGQDKIPKHLMAVGSLFLVGLGPQKELISASDMLYVQKEYSTDTGRDLT